MKSPRFKNWRILSCWSYCVKQLVVQLAPQLLLLMRLVVTVELDLNHQYTVEGKFPDGWSMPEVIGPHYAVYD